MRMLLFMIASAALLTSCSTQQGSMGGAEGSLDAGATGSGAAGAPPDTLMDKSDVSDPTSPDPGAAGAMDGINETP